VACGIQAIFNALAIQHLSEMGIRITSSTIRACTAALAKAGYIKIFHQPLCNKTAGGQIMVYTIIIISVMTALKIQFMRLKTRIGILLKTS
jgi:hypothetical protein